MHDFRPFPFTELPVLQCGCTARSLVRDFGDELWHQPSLRYRRPGEERIVGALPVSEVQEVQNKALEYPFSEDVKELKPRRRTAYYMNDFANELGVSHLTATSHTIVPWPMDMIACLKPQCIHYFKSLSIAYSGKFGQAEPNIASSSS